MVRRRLFEGVYLHQVADVVPALGCHWFFLLTEGDIPLLLPPPRAALFAARPQAVISLTRAIRTLQDWTADWTQAKLPFCHCKVDGLDGHFWHSSFRCHGYRFPPVVMSYAPLS